MPGIDAEGWAWFEDAAAAASPSGVQDAYLRVFASDAGQQVLAHLRAQTIDRRVLPDASGRVLRHLEGQRFVVQMIERLAAGDIVKGTKHE